MWREELSGLLNITWCFFAQTPVKWPHLYSALVLACSLRFFVFQSTPGKIVLRNIEGNDLVE